MGEGEAGTFALLAASAFVAGGMNAIAGGGTFLTFPALVLAGDPPFPALRKFLDERYLPSRLSPFSPDGRGLWVEKSRYTEFHARPPGIRR